MNDRRTLIIHAGGGKAGSSAIQSALGQSVEALAEVGIAYAHAPAASSAYSITSGNGLLLYQRIANPDWPSQGEPLLESYMGGHQIGICSSEFLGSMPESCWRRLAEAAEARAIDLKIVYLVRPPVDYVVASYNQDIKRAGEHRTLDEAVREVPWQHLEDLRKLSKLFDAADLRVINYDLARREIIGAFVAACPELQAAEEDLRRVENITVNRSLTSAETAVMLQLNARFGDKFSEQISDRLIYDDPELRSAVELPEETINILEGKFSDGVNWINSRFFPEPSSALKLRPEGAVRAPDERDTRERALDIVLNWALDKIADRSGDQLAFVRSALLGIDWENSNHPLIPKDFDPIAYLFLNADVLRTNNPPYIHYIQSGHAEQREYRWPLRVEATGYGTIADAIARLRLEDTKDWTKTPLWPRLRHSLQLEALLHGFAKREGEYLREIRRLHEEQGFDNERLRQELDRTVRPMGEAIQEVRAENSQLSESVVTKVRRVKDAVGQRATALQEAVDQRAAELKDALDHRTAELQDALGHRTAELQDALDHRTTEVQSSLSRLTDVLGAEVLALRQERQTLNEMLEQKNAELAEQAEPLRRYRQYGLLKFLKWGLRPSMRP